MSRGEVWWVNVDPSLGGEMQKTRPAVIVSNESSNRALNRLQVVPLTSSVVRIYPCEALVDLNGEPRKAMADQIATVSKTRLRTKLGALREPDIRIEGLPLRQLKQIILRNLAFPGPISQMSPLLAREPFPLDLWHRSTSENQVSELIHRLLLGAWLFEIGL